MKISQRGLIVNATRANRFFDDYVDVFQVVSFHMNIYTNLSQDFEIMSTW